MVKKKLLIAIFFLLETFCLQAQILRNDFNPQFVSTKKIGINAGILLPDGRIVIAGNFITINNLPSYGLARLMPDGSLDASFNSGTGVDGYVSDMALQLDGKIVIAGDFTSYNNKEASNIIRINADGTRDESFVVKVNSFVNAIAIQKDEKILLAGGFNQVNNQSAYKMARLNSDGSHDNTFSIGDGTIGGIFEIALQQDGKIVVGGSFDKISNQTRNSLARLNSNGSLDVGFSTGNGFNNWILALHTQLVDKEEYILVGGAFTSYDGTNIKSIARLKTDGKIDNSFIPTINISVTGMYVDFDQVIVVNERGTAIRLNKDGTLDNSFESNITGNGWSGWWMARNLNGEIIIAGNFDRTNDGKVRTSIAKLSGGGSLIDSFNPILGKTAPIFSIKEQKDGKIIVGGDFQYVNNVAVNSFVRLNPSGDIDNTFNTGTGFNSSVYKIEIQNDGKIIALGPYTRFNGLDRNGIMRLNSDGTSDLTFNSGTGFELNSFETNFGLHLQPDGKIIVGSNFKVYNGTNRVNLVRLNSDGTIDNTFNSSNSLMNQYFKTFTVQSNNKVVVFPSTQYNQGIAESSVLRFLEDGTLDLNFTIKIPGSASHLITDGEDNIYIFSHKSPGPGMNIYKYSANGTSNPNFMVSLTEDELFGGTKDQFASLILNSTSLKDNGLWLGGKFDYVSFFDTKMQFPIRVSHLTKRNFASLAFDGKLNAGVDLDVNGEVTTVVQLTNNRIILTGKFSRVSGELKNGIALCDIETKLPEAPSALTLNYDLSKKLTLAWTDNSDNEAGFEIQRSIGNHDFFTLAVLNKNNITYIDENIDLAKGAHSYKVRAVNSSGASSFAEATNVITDLDNNSLANDISIFPNPTGNIVRIEFLDKNSKTIITLYDVHGNVLLREDESSQIDLTHYSQGLYILELNTSKGKVFKKIFKQ